MLLFLGVVLAEANGKGTAPARSLVARAALIAGVALALSGAMGGFMWPQYNEFTKTRRSEQYVVPGAASVQIGSVRGYTIFHEYWSEVNDQEYETPRDLQGLAVRLVSEATSKPVALTVPEDPAHYVYGWQWGGYAAYEFTPPVAGAYRLEARYPDGREGPKTVLRVSRWQPVNGFAPRISLLWIGLAFGGGLLMVWSERMKLAAQRRCLPVK